MKKEQVVRLEKLLTLLNDLDNTIVDEMNRVSDKDGVAAAYSSGKRAMIDLIMVFLNTASESVCIYDKSGKGDDNNAG